MSGEAEGEALEGMSLEELARAEKAGQAKPPDGDDAKPDGDQAAEGQEGAEDKPPEEDADDPLMLAKWFDEVTDSKESENYKTDHEWARGMKEALSLIGKRGEDAKLGQKVLEAFGGRQDDLLKLLASGKPSDAKPSDDKDGLIEWDDSWLTQDDKGKLVPTASAPADAMQRYSRLQTRYRELASNPRAFMQRMLEPELKKLQQAQTKTKEEMALNEQRAKVEGLCMENRALLYVDGDLDSGMTTEGTQVNERVRDENWMPKIDDWPTRVEMAIELAKGHKPVDRSRKPPRRALRKADVAATPRQTQSLQKRLAEKGLAAVAQEDYEARRAAG